MIEEIKKDADTRMGKSVEVLKLEFSKVRTGRANAALLDHVSVDYYGSDVPISQAANVAVEDARTLVITPWEPPMVAKIEKAIMNSDLGLNPVRAVAAPCGGIERRQGVLGTFGGIISLALFSPILL